MYAGYLASPRQVGIVAEFLDGQPDALCVLDPVMADDGALYSGMDASMPATWRALVARADVVTPNMTEYALLTGEEYSLRPRSAREARGMLENLLDMGAKAAVITSLPLEDGPANAYLSNAGGAPGLCRFERLNAHYPGTGDLFASVLTGALMSGDALPRAVARATNFTRSAVARSMRVGVDAKFGVDLEPILGLLSE